MIQAALDHLDHLQAAGGRALSPLPVYRRLAPELVTDVAASLIADRYDGELASNLLNLLVREASVTVASDVCRQIAASASSPLATQARVRLAALQPNAVVDELVAGEHNPDDISEIAGDLNVTALDHSHLVAAVTVLLDRYPHHDDPQPTSGRDHTAHDQARTVRGHLLRQLAIEGHVEDLDRLRHGRPQLDQHVISSYLHTARARQADLALTATRPQQLLALLRRSDARLIRDDADLQDVVLHQLTALQHEIHHNDAFKEIWNGDAPQTEDDISDWIRRRLHERLTTGLVIDREVQVARPKGHGIGIRIDLTATAQTQHGHVARVIIEAKRIDNDDLLTAMHDQLILRYLVPTGHQHGIYLVYWITPSQRPASWTHAKASNIETLRNILLDQADRAQKDGHIITPYILDISRPA